MAEPFELRPARLEDAAAIRSLIYRAKINPMGLDWRRFTVAVLQTGELIACGQVKPHSDGTRELASVAVLPAWQGRGVGSAIVRHLIEQETGELYLTCRDHLEAYYRRFGFRVLSGPEMPPYFHRVHRIASMLRRLRLTSAQLLVMHLPHKPGSPPTGSLEFSR